MSKTSTKSLYIRTIIPCNALTHAKQITDNSQQHYAESSPSLTAYTHHTFSISGTAEKGVCIHVL